MILFLHHRYRTTGGEERAVADLADVVRTRLGEEVVVLERDSRSVGRGAAAAGVVNGGLAPEAVAATVRRTGARIVHAHNLQPTYGWRALAAAREAGAKVVLHLHNYRLVCAVGTCVDAHGEDCTRCRGRMTAPGVVLGCRGSRAEGFAYAAGLAAWQRRLAGLADAIVVPSASALERLRVLRAPLGDRVHVVGHPVAAFAARSSAADGRYALVVSRLAPEKGVELAVEACRRAGLRLLVAGDGPCRDALLGAGGVELLGRVGGARLAELRAGAGVELVPSRAAETFGLAAVEAMAAGVPVVASAVGALRELADGVTLVPPGDVDALARAARAAFCDVEAGERGLRVARAVADPAVVAAKLAGIYQAAVAGG